MTHRTFAEMIQHMLDLIEPTLDGIEQGGDEVALRDIQVLLRQLLIDCMRLCERNPGIEAAVADLYGAASALVRDNGIDSQPMARKLRLFRESRGRFRQRVLAARPSEHGTKVAWRHYELLCA